jgi:hypothetical protein
VSQTVGGCESSEPSQCNGGVYTSTYSNKSSKLLQCYQSNRRDLTATGTNLQWYSAATGGSPLAPSTALTTATYYVSQTVGGCESSRTPVNVTVGSVPAPAATSPQNFCSATNPTVANLTATGTNLQWYSAATGGSPLAPSTALTTATYYVSQTVGGCESSRTSVNVTVSSITPSVTITATTTTICSGNPITFTAAATNGGTTPAYQWQVNGINAGTNSSTFTTSLLGNGDQVTVIMTSNASCITTTTVTSNTITITTTSVTPAVSIAASSTLICAGSSVTFTATPTNGGTNPTYQWQINGANAGTNSPTFTTSSLANGDQVTVIMTSNASCATTTTATSNTITITSTSVTPAVSLAASSTSICAGSSVTFTATPTNGGTNPTYQWQVNGVNAGTNSPTFTTSSLANGDQVTVIMTSNASCITNCDRQPLNTITIATTSSVTPSVSIACQFNFHLLQAVA